MALVDTGVARVPGLAGGNVVDGPDLSFESQHTDVRYQDTFGHGTHMASIVAGRDTAGTPTSYTNPGQFDGVAPDALDTRPVEPAGRLGGQTAGRPT